MEQKDLIETVNDKIAKSAIKDYDEYVLKAFAVHGYSKEWVLDPENLKRIHVRTNRSVIRNNYADQYYIDDMHLFTIKVHYEIVYDDTPDGLGIKLMTEFKMSHEQ